MPPLFMYSRPVKLRTSAWVPGALALSYAAISAGSHAAVTSPVMSTTATEVVGWRTSMLRSGMVIGVSVVRGWVRASADGCVGDGALDIGVHVDEVRESRDGEDVLVVRCEAGCRDLPAVGARAAEDADDEGDPGRVDVVDVGEVQEHGRRRHRGDPLVRRRQGGHRIAVDLPMQADHSEPPVVDGLDVIRRRHRELLPVQPWRPCG